MDLSIVVTALQTVGLSVAMGTVGYLAAVAYYAVFTTSPPVPTPTRARSASAAYRAYEFI